MRNIKLSSLSDQEILDAIAQFGSCNKAADGLGIPRATFKERSKGISRLVSQRLPKPVKVAPPRHGHKSFILSSAQNGTEIDEQFFTNLEAYAAALDAEIIISGYTYNKSLFEDHSKAVADFHERVKPYLSNRQVDIGGKLLFCAEMNTQPTATDPLSGFEAYTRSKWGVFPHPRVSLKSIATMFGSPPKIIQTTGSVTKRNYVQKKSGLKAEFHHVIAALLVEIDADGDIFTRHLIAEKDGSFQDLTTRVENGKVKEGFRVEAITWGDVHTSMLDKKVALGAWGIDEAEFTQETENCMLEDLAPKYQFFHDVLDFRPRNHHNMDDPHHMFEMFCASKESVADEVADVAEFLQATSRDWCRSIVVDSNHDRALKKWLKRADYRRDPVNAEFFLRAQAEVYASIRQKRQNFHLLEWAVRASRELDPDADVTFLTNTDSFVICKHAGGGIECAIHGDQGANGAKGSVTSFTKMGPKANTADKHGAEIHEGIYQAGHSCKRDMVYNRGGLTSWNHSHIVTLPSGKRQMITMQGSKYRA
jgi:hypothetical protein